MKNHTIKILYAALCLHAFSIAQQEHPIMSYTDYAQLQHKYPYTYTLTSTNQHIFYFGATHSCNLDDAQFSALENFWQEFLQATKGRDCIVLVEGSLRPVKPTREEAISMAGGEGGYITFLAHQASVPVACPEPQKSQLVRKLLEEFSPEEIAYKEFTQNALQACRYRAAGRLKTLAETEKYLNACLDDFSSFYTTCFYPQTFTFKNMQTIHRNLFNTDLDLFDENFFYTITNPANEHSLINTICRRASCLRDQTIVDYIENAFTKGKNIFIVYGATHAVMQEKAIESIMCKNSI